MATSVHVHVHDHVNVHEIRPRLTLEADVVVDVHVEVDVVVDVHVVVIGFFIRLLPVCSVKVQPIRGNQKAT